MGPPARPAPGTSWSGPAAQGYGLAWESLQLKAVRPSTPSGGPDPSLRRPAHTTPAILLVVVVVVVTKIFDPLPCLCGPLQLPSTGENTAPPPASRNGCALHSPTKPRRLRPAATPPSLMSARDAGLRQ
ncbi:hypothetical protein E2C01_050371 [Portunus trituberculatus]|uniref:Uncharacterized protein n=1 Tax=Portunus trituberculatus TaxID=210409 RepID=A0A5B7GFX8_PORTR|nr:hypothetical protein [Portunus trituberculatus]